MRKLIIYTFIFSLMISLSACLRLDDNLYNGSKLNEYKFDDYIGEQDFILDSSYNIPASKFNYFTLESKGEKDKKSYKIHCVYLGDLSRIATDTVILYCHGNKDHMDFYWQRAKLMANTGGKNRFGVMMFDYRGYGLSEGKPTEDGMYNDADACMKWLKAKGLSDSRFVIYGFSLGTAPSCELTANPRTLTPHKIILEAPFASVEVMEQDASKTSMHGSYFTDLKIDNANEIQKVKQDFCWMHGIEDDFLSIKTHGEVVYKNYHGNYSEAHRIESANHSTVPQTIGYTAYNKLLADFIIR